MEGKQQEIDDDDDDGPPPGWDSFQPRQPTPTPPPPPPPPASQPPPQPAASSENISTLGVTHRGEIREDERIEKMEHKQELVGDDEGPPPGWDSVQPQQPTPTPPPPVVHPPRDEGPPPGWDSVQPQQPTPTPPPPAAQPPRESAVTSDKAQMVCGSCRRLLSYPRGSRHVQCSCCQTVNIVLEAHQVGQVKCASCKVLLMYPHGAQSVRCSSCRFVTEIGEHNKRPPLSAQQGRPPMPPNPVH